MKNDRYIEYIQLARKIVAEADLATLEYQVVAFEIVLKHLLDSADEDEIEARLERRIESRRERDEA